MRRGRERGAWAKAVPLFCPKASLPSSVTIKLRLLFRILGKGWAGSRPMGLITGSNSRLKKRFIQLAALAVHSERLRKRIPSAASLGDEKGVQHLVLLFNEPMRRLADAAELLGRGEIVRSPLHRSIGHLLFETRHPDLEEFIEIGAADTEKLQTFEQRDGLVLSKFEHAAVELQKTQFPVDVKLGLAEIGDLGGRRGSGRGLG